MFDNQMLGLTDALPASGLASIVPDMTTHRRKSIQMEDIENVVAASSNAIEDDQFDTDSLQRQCGKEFNDPVMGFNNDQLCLADALDRLEQGQDMS